jgi:hypothetical protein
MSYEDLESGADHMPDMQPLGCAKSRSVARLSLRLPSASRTESPDGYVRTVDLFPVLSWSELAPDPVPWWRWWLR